MGYGYRHSVPGTLLNALEVFLNEVDDDDEELPNTDLVDIPSLLRYKFLPLLQLIYPNWAGVEEIRRSFNGKKMQGIKNIQLKTETSVQMDSSDVPLDYFTQTCPTYPWWTTMKGKKLAHLWTFVRTFARTFQRPTKLGM